MHGRVGGDEEGSNLTPHQYPVRNLPHTLQNADTNPGSYVSVGVIVFERCCSSMDDAERDLEYAVERGTGEWSRSPARRSWEFGTLLAHQHNKTSGPSLTAHCVTTSDCLTYLSRDGGIRTRDPLNPIQVVGRTKYDNL